MSASYYPIFNRIFCAVTGTYKVFLPLNLPFYFHFAMF